MFINIRAKAKRFQQRPLRHVGGSLTSPTSRGRGPAMGNLKRKIVSAASVIIIRPAHLTMSSGPQLRLAHRVSYRIIIPTHSYLKTLFVCLSVVPMFFSILNPLTVCMYTVNLTIPTKCSSLTVGNISFRL